jgi:hypothetical protein
MNVQMLNAMESQPETAHARHAPVGPTLGGVPRGNGQVPDENILSFHLTIKCGEMILMGKMWIARLKGQPTLSFGGTNSGGGSTSGFKRPSSRSQDSVR